MDFRAFRARSWNGVAQELTEKEAMILKVLAEHPGEIVSREDLLEKVWGYDVFPSTRTVDNFILRLRKRFERDPANPRHFLTVWGVGYRFLKERHAMSARPLRIGTRASALALWQAHHVAGAAARAARRAGGGAGAHQDRGRCAHRCAAVAGRRAGLLHQGDRPGAA